MELLIVPTQRVQPMLSYQPFVSTLVICAMWFPSLGVLMPMLVISISMQPLMMVLVSTQQCGIWMPMQMGIT